ncbi:MAG: carbonic anhydrase [Planctomycetes bacterium]|nr:carbonic anhydrase [Planctomycetota bacterium]MCH9725997.1 carbonic anhydrase [Planctomycetota bacterium]MCH9777150.1 carbonic anhydrase [Planctomycetota bacterium]MCH9790869.1 carbonic anhydrase [Planctomycetota bacterium]MDF1744058.1 carbonic anhydrase [Gimesia sp.]
MAKRASKTPVKKKNKLSANAALVKLKKGNQRYLGHDPINYQTEEERADFANGQKPYAAILSCADSRVSPEIMFNAGLDELFVIRVAGNIADTTSIASIEYAVSELNTNLIVVVGHESCGAVNAAIANANNTLDLGYNLNSLLAHINPAIAATDKKKIHKKDRLTATVKENARLNAKELRTRSPIIAKARGVKIVSAYYHLITGEVDFSDFL